MLLEDFLDAPLLIAGDVTNLVFDSLDLGLPLSLNLLTNLLEVVSFGEPCGGCGNSEHIVCCILRTFNF